MSLARVAQSLTYKRRKSKSVVNKKALSVKNQAIAAVRPLDGPPARPTIRRVSAAIVPTPHTADALAPADPASAYGPAPYVYSPPLGAGAPVLFASPHSGRHYPAPMLRALAVPLERLRRTEDAHVDALFDAVPALGAGLLAAHYARSVVDLNREAGELDAAMFADGAPRVPGPPTPRVEAGLGCLPRAGAEGEAIYRGLLSRCEGAARLERVYDAFHARLDAELDALAVRYGTALLIDCHSMPSRPQARRPLADVVLGDRFGASCDPGVVQAAESAFRAEGLTVSRNAPYAGGHITRRHGRPGDRRHALQIEVRRDLYMNEKTLERTAGFRPLKAALAAVSGLLVGASRSLAAT